MKVSGDGTSGVMVVGEAIGEDDAKYGVPFVGKSGHFLWNALARVGVDRDTLTVANSIFCRPPDNKLVGMSYEQAAINACRPNLDAAIADAKKVAENAGKTFVIVTLGKTAFMRVLGLDSKQASGLLKEDYYCYPFWSINYNCWVIAAAHPGYLMKGKHHEVPVLVFAFRRALEIASHGLTLAKPTYLLDPDPAIFSNYVDDYLKELAANPSSTFLSYDIETPYKRGKAEDQIAKEDEEDYTILRVAFAFRPNEAVSVPWTAAHYTDFQRLFASSGAKLGWNSDVYDRPRVEFHLGERIKGDHLDGMLAWHVLNSALPKGLGFVAPFYAQTSSMWKHLSSAEPAFYNAKDADMALQIWLGVKEDLRTNNLWEVFDRHVIQLNRVYEFMSSKGVLLDKDKRQAAEDKLTAMLESSEAAIAAVIPQEVLQLKPFAKTPKEVLDARDRVLNNILLTVGSDGFEIPPYGSIDKRVAEITGLVQIPGQRKTTKCPLCSKLDVKADHYKSTIKQTDKCKRCGAQRRKHCWGTPGEGHALGCNLMHHEFVGDPDNPCCGEKSVKVAIPATVWAKPLPFKLSNQSLRRYQAHMKQRPVLTPKERKVTFDDKAITKLMNSYPNDKLYPLIGEFRANQKLLGTYIGRTQSNGKQKGGMQTGRDGRIHPTVTHNPSTLRSAMQDPNMQNLPRPQGPDDPASLIRGMIVASPGSILYARDFSGIEAKIVGYEALYPEYIRLCNLDVHSFYTAWALSQVRPGAIPTNDLPQLSWDDEKLGKRLKEIKKEFGKERNNLYKHLVHGANFMQGAKGATDTILRMTGQFVPVSTVSRVMNVYFELFPNIKKWHSKVLAQADRDGYLRNPFGYVHRFHSVYSWEKWGNEWDKKPGPQANEVVAFLPQSTAAGIIKESMLRIWDSHPDVGQFLRLLVHDELFFECPEDQLEHVDSICKMEMEKPITQMKQPPSWGMGDHFLVTTEAKQGYIWGEMK